MHRTPRIRGRGGGAWPRLRVGIELPDAAGGGRDGRDVLGGMHAQELVAGGVARSQEFGARLEAAAPNPVAQRGQPLGTLRMSGPRVVLEEHGMVVEPDSHAVDQCRPERNSFAAAASLGRISNTSPTIP